MSLRSRRLASAAASVVLAATPFESALFVIFEPSEVRRGDDVTVRLRGTPPEFAVGNVDGLPPRPIRVFLVPNYAVPDVTSAGDRRLTYVATIDVASQTYAATFRVPDLAPGLYAAAFDCPDCQATASRPNFVAVDAVEGVPTEYRGRVGLTVRDDPVRWWLPVLVALVLGGAAFAAAGRRRRRRASAA